MWIATSRMFMTEVPIVWYMGHTSSALNAAALLWPRHTKPKTKILMMTPQKRRCPDSVCGSSVWNLLLVTFQCLVFWGGSSSSEKSLHPCHKMLHKIEHTIMTQCHVSLNVVIGLNYLCNKRMELTGVSIHWQNCLQILLLPL